MADEQRQLRRNDLESGETLTHKFSKEELIRKLNSTGLPTNGTKADLQQRCNRQQIPIYEERAKIVEGWTGKPKGMLQLLWERGFLDPSISADKLWDTYSIKPKKDAFGNVLPGTGLREMVSALPDFVDEKTLLQHHAESRSIEDGCQITMIRSPKCHPELAGEGIEYDWAVAKKFYRMMKMADKKTKEKCFKSVQASLDKVDPKSRRSSSKRAREYMLAYDTLEAWKEDETRGQEPESSAHFLDSVVKERRSHRSVSHDGKFVSRMVAEMKARPIHAE